MRAIVLARDAHHCQDCGSWEDPCQLDVHHLVPRSAGGGDEPSNLITLCDGCHGARHPNLQVSLSRRMIERWGGTIAHCGSESRMWRYRFRPSRRSGFRSSSPSVLGLPNRDFLARAGVSSRPRPLSRGTGVVAVGATLSRRDERNSARRIGRSANKGPASASTPPARLCVHQGRSRHA